MRRTAKRATQARPGRAHGKSCVLKGLSLALGATAAGMTGALGLQCSGDATTSVTTSHVRIGPQGTSAENS